MNPDENALDVLVAEDNRTLREILTSSVEQWGLTPQPVSNGREAWKFLHAAQRPTLALIDWVMPELDGLEVCRRVRQETALPPIYLVLVTAKTRPEDLAAGLAAGADDYVRKPFDPVELEARIRVGMRTLGLQLRLADRVQALEQALRKVDQLQGILPICTYCRRVRDDQNYWKQVEDYVAEHLDARVSHSICPTCFELARAELEAIEDAPTQEMAAIPPPGKDESS